MSTQIIENEDKPLTDSWRARIRKRRGFVFMVNDFIMLCPDAATNPELKKRIEDNCETLYKLGAAEVCGINSNGNGKPEEEEGTGGILRVEGISGVDNYDDKLERDRKKIVEEPARDVVETHSEYTNMRLYPPYSDPNDKDKEIVVDVGPPKMKEEESNPLIIPQVISDKLYKKKKEELKNLMSEKSTAELPSPVMTFNAKKEKKKKKEPHNAQTCECCG